MTTFNQVSTSISESLGQTFLGGVLGIQPPDSTWLLDPISCFLGELLIGLSTNISLVSIVFPLHFHTHLRVFLPNSTNSASWEELRKWRKQKQAISDKEKNAWVKYISRKNELVGKMKGQFTFRNGRTGDKQQSWDRSRAKEENQWIWENNNIRMLNITSLLLTQWSSSWLHLSIT